MDLIPVNASGIPQLDIDEVEWLVIDGKVESHYPSIQLSGRFRLRLTNFRLLLQSNEVELSHHQPTSSPPCQAVPLQTVFDLVPSITSFWQRDCPHLEIFFELMTIQEKTSITIILDTSQQFQRFTDELKKQLHRKSWMKRYSPLQSTSTSSLWNHVVPSSSLPTVKSNPFSTTHAGIGGISRLLQSNARNINDTMREAFQDTESLFENAAEMVSIAQRLANFLEQSSSNETTVEARELHQKMVYKMGIFNPVTRSGHDSMQIYYDELAREINHFLVQSIESDFVLSPQDEYMTLFHQSKYNIQTNKVSRDIEDMWNMDDNKSLRWKSPGVEILSNFNIELSSLDQLSYPMDPLLIHLEYTGLEDPKITWLEKNNHRELRSSSNKRKIMIPLTDLYCMWNRARGTALVSPQDLLEACRRLQYLKLNYHLVELNKEVLMLVSGDYNQEEEINHIVKFISIYGFMSMIQLATYLHIPLGLARHYLLQAEEMELLCRDQSSEGLFFWPNIFQMNPL